MQSNSFFKFTNVAEGEPDEQQALNVTSIVLRDIDMTGYISLLDEFRNLVFARVISCKIRSLQTLPIFRQLVVLDLQDNRIQKLGSPEFWGAMPHLSVLNLIHN